MEMPGAPDSWARPSHSKMLAVKFAGRDCHMVSFMPSVTADDVVEGLHRLGLLGKPVCLHSSLRSFGAVAGGADTVIDGFREAGCTLIVPSFSWRFAVPPPEKLRPARNAWDYGARPDSDAAPATYCPETPEIDRDMGAIPAAVITRPGHLRGDHPLCSFTALGPLAQEAVARQTWNDVYAPLRWLGLGENNGAVLLAGVSLISLTLVHYAEQLAGRTLFRRWAMDKQGTVRMVPVGGCSNGFGKLAPLLAPLSKTTFVGASSWVAYPASPTVTALTTAIRGQPEITRCPNRDCVRCRDSIQGGPLL